MFVACVVCATGLGDRKQNLHRIRKQETEHSTKEQTTLTTDTKEHQD